MNDIFRKRNMNDTSGLEIPLALFIMDQEQLRI